MKPDIIVDYLKPIIKDFFCSEYVVLALIGINLCGIGKMFLFIGFSLFTSMVLTGICVGIFILIVDFIDKNKFFQK